MSQDNITVMQCDCYVHGGTRFVNKIVEKAAARRNSLCPLLGLSTMAPPGKFTSQAQHKVPHRRIDDEALVEEMYKFGRQLGQGSFGVVLEATDLKTNKKWAVKKVNKEKAGSSDVLLLEREVAILKKVNHEHIIHIEEIFETSKKTFLVMEICEFGDLKTLLFSKGPFSEETTRRIIKDLANVVVYLHKNGIVHRDIKLENILVASCEESESKEPLYDIRLTDFGLSVVKEGVGSDHMLQASCGTPVYMGSKIILLIWKSDINKFTAPEIIQNHDYSQQCDNWSIGVILYALLARRFPFVADSEEQLFLLIKQGTIEFAHAVWADKSESVKSLIRNILVVDPAHRYTASEIASHPWIMGRTDLNTSMPTNVLAMMKDYAKMGIMDEDNDEISAETDQNQPTELNLEDNSLSPLNAAKANPKTDGTLSKSKVKSAPTDNTHSEQHQSLTGHVSIPASDTLRKTSFSGKHPVKKTPLNSISKKIPDNKALQTHTRSTSRSPAQTTRNRDYEYVDVLSSSTKASLSTHVSSESHMKHRNATDKLHSDTPINQKTDDKSRSHSRKVSILNKR